MRPGTHPVSYEVDIGGSYVVGTATETDRLPPFSTNAKKVWIFIFFPPVSRHDE
jgi:hypothetical protein